MVTLLNTSVLTNYGTYTYEPVTLEQAREIIAAGYNSAIGHQATADIASELLEVPVAVNRATYAQQVGEVALIFKLKTRVGEGRILNREEIDAIGYEFGLLTRID